MPGCANFNDGSEKLMCVFETTEASPDHKCFSIKSVVSPDVGKTWGTRSQVLLFRPSGSGKNAGAPQIVALPDGNLVVSFMTDEDTMNGSRAFKIVTGPPVATGDWGHKTMVTGPQSEGPGLFTKSDGSVLGCASAPAGLICKDITFTAN